MRRKKFYGKSVIEVLNKAQAEIDCLTPQEREKISGMLNKELPRDVSPLDIDTVEQQYKSKEYGMTFKVEAKSTKDDEKAKFIEWVMNQEKFKDEYKRKMVEATLYGYGIDPVKYLKPEKKGINIPINEIKEALNGDKHGG